MMTEKTVDRNPNNIPNLPTEPGAYWHFATYKHLTDVDVPYLSYWNGTMYFLDPEGRWCSYDERDSEYRYTNMGPFKADYTHFFVRLPEIPLPDWFNISEEEN